MCRYSGRFIKPDGAGKHKRALRLVNGIVAVGRRFFLQNQTPITRTSHKLRSGQ